MSFECGEELLVLTRGDETEKEWWWARNNREETGYIPRNLLGVGNTFLILVLIFMRSTNISFLLSS